VMDEKPEREGGREGEAGRQRRRERGLGCD
jgi:hypothetical protein